MVTALEAQAGSPPTAAKMLERLARIDGLGRLDQLRRDWARWFADIEETHTSIPSLVVFRSPQPDRSWVTAAATVLDAALIVSSTLELARQPEAELCIRAGYLSMRRIGDFFVMPYDPAPRPDDPISIRREEFDRVCQRLAAAGACLKPNHDQAWRDFAGWRVNYDAVLYNSRRYAWPRGPVIVRPGDPVRPWLAHPPPGTGTLVTGSFSQTSTDSATSREFEL